MAWQGHSGLNSSESFDASPLLAQLETLARSELTGSVLVLFIQWPALIQGAIDGLSHGLNTSSLASIADVAGLIALLNTVLPDALVMGIPPHSTIRQPMLKFELVVRQEGEFTSWTENAARDVLPDSTDRTELLRQVYRWGLFRGGLLDLGLTQPDLLRNMLQHSWIMDWLTEFARKMPKRDGQDDFAGVVEHTAQILGAGNIANTLTSRQRLMIRLLLRLSSNWLGPFQIYQCPQVVLPQVNSQINDGVQELYGIAESGGTVSTSVLTLFINNPALLQAIMNPVSFLAPVQMTSPPDIQAGLNHINAALCSSSFISRKLMVSQSLAAIILNQPVITHAWIAAISSEAQALTFLQFIASVPVSTLSQLTANQMQLLILVARINTESSAQSRVVERSYFLVLIALQPIARDLLDTTFLNQVAEYLSRQFHGQLSDNPTSQELLDLLK